MMTLLAVGVAAGLGALLRRNLTVWFRRYISELQGYLATLLINLSGSFLLGYLAGGLSTSSLSYAFLAIGLMGGLTTYSSFNSELVNLWFMRRHKSFFLYLLGSYLAGLLLVALGYWCG